MNPSLTLKHPQTLNLPSIAVTILYQIPLIVIAIAAYNSTYAFVSTYGPWTTPDTANYFSTATRLVEGNGFVMYNDAPLTMWAPFYPILLAAIQIVFGIKPFDAIPQFNAILFGVIVYLGGNLFLRHLKSPLVAYAGTVTLLFSLPFFENRIQAMSEVPFIVLLLLFFLFFEFYQEKPRFWLAILMGASVGLAALTRYVGFVLIPLGVGLLWFVTTGTRRERLRAIILFTGTALVFFGWWMVRMYVLTGSPFGSRGQVGIPVDKSIVSFFDVVFSWFAADVSSGTPLALVIVGIAIGSLVGYAWRDQWVSLRPALWQHGDLLFFVILYVVVLIYQEATSVLNPINNRLLAPIVIPLFVLILVYLQMLMRKLLPLHEGVIASCILAFAVVQWLPYPQSTLETLTKPYLEAHGIGWNNKYWNNSPTIAYLRGTPLDCKLYSNAPDALWLQAEIPAIQLTPFATVPVFQNKNTVCVVLLDGVNRSYMLNLDDLQKRAQVDTIAKFQGGALYRVTPK